MSELLLKEYDAKIDSKKRITLRNALFEYYHVYEMNDGKIVLEPRELVKPLSISSNTLSMMDESIKNLNENKVSDVIDLSYFEDK